MKCLVYHGAMQTTNPWTKNLHGYTVKSVTNWMKWTSEFYSVCYGFSDKDSQSFTSETFRKVSLTKMACRFLFIYMEGFIFFPRFFCTFCFGIISDFFFFSFLYSLFFYTISFLKRWLWKRLKFPRLYDLNWNFLYVNILNCDCKTAIKQTKQTNKGGAKFDIARIGVHPFYDYRKITNWHNNLRDIANS